MHVCIHMHAHAHTHTHTHTYTHTHIYWKVPSPLMAYSGSRMTVMHHNNYVLYDVL